MRQLPPDLDAETVHHLEELGGEELLRQLVNLLLDLVPQRLGAIEEALRRDDLLAARQAAHALCSTAGTVGAMTLLKAAQLVEAAHGAPEALAAAGILETEWPPLRQRLSQWLNEP